MIEDIETQKQLTSRFKIIIKAMRKAILKVEGAVFGIGVFASLVSCAGAVFAEIAHQQTVGNILFGVTGAVTALNTLNFARATIKNKKMKKLESFDDATAQDVANKFAADKNPQISYYGQTLLEINNYANLNNSSYVCCDPEKEEVPCKYIALDRIQQRLQLIERGVIDDDKGVAKIN